MAEPLAAPRAASIRLLPGLTGDGGATPSAGALLSYLDGLLSHSGGVMFVRSLEGRLLLANDAFATLAGRPAGQIIGCTSHDLFPAELADEHLANDRLVISDGVARTVRERAIDETGETRFFASHKFPLLDGSGRPFAVGGIAMDVTDIEAERRESREARIDSEARFRAVFDHAPIGQIFSDLTGTVTSVNEPMAAMLGYAPHEMVGRTVREFTPAEEFEHIRRAVEALLSRDADATNEIRTFRHRLGHDVPVRVTSALLRDDEGRPRWWISMVLDLTDEERTRDQLERAHIDALNAADRLRLLHSIATAANEATRVRDLAPQVLETVCDGFGWDGGALVLDAPADGGTGAEVICEFGDASGCLQALPADVSGVRVCGEVVAVPAGITWRGRLTWVFATGSESVHDSQLEVLSLIGIETGRVTERATAAAMLRDSEERFRSVFDSSPLPMGLTLGTTGTYAAVNNALCELVGRTPEELIGASARDICHPDDIALTDPAGAAALAAPDRRHRLEMRLLHSSGATVTAMVTLVWLDSPDGSMHLLAQMEDVTAQRSMEEALRRQAEHDGLTGLANRAHLGRVLQEMAVVHAPCSVLFIDLDGFKVINDTRGHDVGDEVLLEVARRLLGSARPNDLVARFGGDEFVIVSADDAPSVAAHLADRVRQALAEPILTQTGPAVVTASVGIATGHLDSCAPQQLVRQADVAMYHAKRLGKDRGEVYDGRLHEISIEHQRTESALRHALDDERFILHYQPIVDLDDCSIVGFEALVRLVDEAGKIVPPDRFIAVAEETGLIVPMGAWVLEQACRAIARLRHQTGRELTMSVNIAARQAARPDLAETVLAAIAAARIPESALCLELTESSLLEAEDQTLQQLVELRARGVGIGLDDFGTGYSSLTYLRRFPVTHVKVDRSFVTEMACDASDRAIVRAVTGLAEDLGMRWIAEGVETLEQRDALRGLGAGLAQGYLFSRPEPLDKLCDLLGLQPVRRSA